MRVLTTATNQFKIARVPLTTSWLMTSLLAPVALEPSTWSYTSPLGPVPTAFEPSSTIWSPSWSSSKCIPALTLTVSRPIFLPKIKFALVKTFAVGTLAFPPGLSTTQTSAPSTTGSNNSAWCVRQTGRVVLWDLPCISAGVWLLW